MAMIGLRQHRSCSSGRLRELPRGAARALAAVFLLALPSCGGGQDDEARRRGFEQGRTEGYEHGLAEGREDAMRAARQHHFFWYGAGGFLTGFLVALAFGTFLLRERLREAVRRQVNLRQLKRHCKEHESDLSEEAFNRVMPILERHRTLMASLEGRRGALANELYQRLAEAPIPVPRRTLDLGVLLTSLAATRAAFPQPVQEAKRSLRVLVQNAKPDLAEEARETREEQIRLQKDRARQLVKLDENLERVRTKLDNIETFLGNLAMEVSQWSLVESDGSLTKLPVDVSRDIDRLAVLVREVSLT